MSKGSRGVGCIGLLAGLALAAFAGWQGWNRATFLETAVRTEGIVYEVIGTNGRGTSLVRRSGTRSFRSYNCTRFQARVRFQNASGQEFNETISSGSARGHNQPISSANHTVGARIPMVYDPASPSTVYEDSFFSLWKYVVIFGILSAVFCLTGLISLARD